MEKEIRLGTDFSGVGSVNQALIRLGIEYDEVFACEMDKFARQTYKLNYGKPKYYPTDVYSREIPVDPLDLYITTPPCQAFSLAGARKGEEDERGILFYNSHEFIQKNKPRYFIFENVKGLLSDDKGKTFARWVDFLGGKSVNGSPIIFPNEKSVPYHIYYKVLNAKNYGVPQNRERVFIIGIRDDSDNDFNFPKEVELKKRLKDILEIEVDCKYFLSDKIIDFSIKHTEKHRVKGNGFKFKPKSRNTGLDTEQMLEINESGTSNCLTTVKKDNVVVYGNLRGGKWEKTHEQSGRVYNINGCSPTIHTMGGGNQEPKIAIKSATKQGFEIATPGDSINLEYLNSETRRGRVGKGVDQTLTISCNQGVYNGVKIRKLTPRECFRLMDFNESFKLNVSDTQAYKQAGNSVVVKMFELLIKELFKDK